MAVPRAGRWPAQGKCTPLRFTWKDNAVNVGKLMRYELVKELQDAGPDVEVECTGDPTELTELKIKDEVRPTDEPALPGLQTGSCLDPKPHTGLPASLQTGRRCRARLCVARWWMHVPNIGLIPAVCHFQATQERMSWGGLLSRLNPRLDCPALHAMQHLPHVQCMR